MRGWNTGHPHSVSHQRPWLKGVVRYEGQLISEKGPPTTGQPAHHPTFSHFPIATAQGGAAFEALDGFEVPHWTAARRFKQVRGVRLSRSLGSFRSSTLDQRWSIRAGSVWARLSLD